MRAAKTTTKAKTSTKQPSKKPAEKPPLHKPKVVKLARLKEHPENYRLHPEDQILHIVESIKDNGFYRNVVIARDNTILAGHGSVIAAKRAGLEEVTVVQLDIEADSPLALRIVAGDNEISKLAEVDDRKLTEMLRKIGESTGKLLGTGFDSNMLAALAFNTRSAAELSTPDDAAQWVGMPGYEPTQIRKHSLIITFDDTEAREQFVKANELIIHKKVGVEAGSSWSTCWPPRSRDDINSLRFQEEKP